MSRDLQDAVNNFVLGFNLGDKIVARHQAAQAAKYKWDVLGRRWELDRIEKEKRNAAYAQQVAAHNKLYEAQAEWYRTRGAGGRGGVKVSGGPAYSAADQAFIDKQNALGVPVYGAPDRPSISVEMPEQPPPMPPALPQPPGDDSSFSATDAAFMNDARGGTVPDPRTLPLSSLGVGGTSGPGSGFGVRASPPSYQKGGNVQPGWLPPPWKYPGYYTLPFHSIYQGIQRYAQPFTPEEKAERERDAAMYENPAATLPYQRPLPQKQDVPSATLKTPTVKVTPATSFFGEEARADETPRPSDDERGPAGMAYGSEPDVPPQGVFKPTAGTGGGGRGAISTGWKGLRDPTRVEAYDPVKDRLDPYNRMYVTDDYRVAPWAQQDWAARWNNQNLWGSPTVSGPPGSGETYQEGGLVDENQAMMARNQAQFQQQAEISRRMTPSTPATGGSANAATGSGGDAAGGVSGSGGIGGSATGGQGGSAAAGTSGQGVSGDDGGTYRRGGRVRYRAGGMVREPDDEDDDEGYNYADEISEGMEGRPRNPRHLPAERDPALRRRSDEYDFYGNPKGPSGTPYDEQYNYETQVPNRRMNRGGRVQRFQSGGTPTPRIAGNLPPSPGYDEYGREIPARDIEWYERVDPRSDAAVPPVVDRWAPPPAPPEWLVAEARYRNEIRRGMAAGTEPDVPPQRHSEKRADPNSPPGTYAGWRHRPPPRLPYGSTQDQPPPLPEFLLEDYDALHARGSAAGTTDDVRYTAPYPPSRQPGGAAAGTEPDVPPGRPAPPPFYGEEARADETRRQYPGGGYLPGPGGTAAATEPDVPPQGRPAPRPSGAIDTGRWRGQDPRDKAFDPTTQQLDPRSGMTIDASGRVTPIAQGDTAAAPSAPGGRPLPPVTEPMGGYGMNPQGANAYGAGLSTNNAANDMTAIMRSASDFAGHTFHLNQNDQFSAGGYHAIMAGHGAAPINMIDAGFKKIDPQGRMPVNQKIEMLAEHTYDYWVGQGQPEKAAKVAFEIGQFGNTMAKKHAKSALDALQQGDMHGAVTQLVGGYNWLVDGHTADYDGRTITLRDSKTGQVTGQLPIDPKMIQNLALGMSSGELNWDIMRGRGQAAVGGQLPSLQRIPGSERPVTQGDLNQFAGQPPPGPPAVQPAAAPAGPLDAAPPGGAAPPNAMGEGGGEQPRGAVDTGVPWTPVGPTGRNINVTSEPAPAGAPNAPRGQRQAPQVPQGDQPQPGRPKMTGTPQPTPQQPGKEPEEGSDEWYEKHPNDLPNREIRRQSYGLGPQPDWGDLRKQAEADYAGHVQRINEDAKSVSKQGKTLVQQALAFRKDARDKRIQEIKDAEKEWATRAQKADDQESRRVQERRVQAQSTEGNIDSAFEKYLADKRTAYDKMDPIAMSKAIKDGTVKPDAKSRADAEAFATVHQSPLRYMATPDDRARLKEIATKIWVVNPRMSEREAIEHAMAFTSYVPDNAKGFNRGKGDKGTWYRQVGRDPFTNLVLQNEAGEQVHVDRNTMTQINGLRIANARESKEGDKKRTETRREEQMRGNMLERTGKFLRQVAPVDPVTTTIRGVGEAIPGGR